MPLPSGSPHIDVSRGCSSTYSTLLFKSPYVFTLAVQLNASTSTPTPPQCNLSNASSIPLAPPHPTNRHHLSTRVLLCFHFASLFSVYTARCASVLPLYKYSRSRQRPPPQVHRLFILSVPCIYITPVMIIIDARRLQFRMMLRQTMQEAKVVTVPEARVSKRLQWLLCPLSTCAFAG